MLAFRYCNLAYLYMEGPLTHLPPGLAKGSLLRTQARGASLDCTSLLTRVVCTIVCEPYLICLYRLRCWISLILEICSFLAKHPDTCSSSPVLSRRRTQQQNIKHCEFNVEGTCARVQVHLVLVTFSRRIARCFLQSK